MATHTLRTYGIPCSQYSDNRHLSELWGTQIKRNSRFHAANCAFFVAGTLLTQLGYFLHLSKCVPIPKQQLIFLGHLVHTVRQTFSIPEEKKQKFVTLREEILSLAQVPLNMLQRFQGKCFPFTLMVSAAQLYTRVVAQAISRAQRLGASITLEGDLRKEISHWRFLDSWTGCAPWRTEEHKVVKLLASDPLQSRWGATLSIPGGVEFTGDYFGEDL